jgi:hypothetical protein
MDGAWLLLLLLQDTSQGQHISREGGAHTYL